jgi:hypothetical protein
MQQLNPDDPKQQNFKDRIKRIGSFKDTKDGLKNVNAVKLVNFNELPPPPPPPPPEDLGSKRKEREEPQQLQLHPLTLYKYVIIRELDGTYKIYYSCARGLYHFDYIDYYYFFFYQFIF